MVCGIFTRTSTTSREESQVSIHCQSCKLTEDDHPFGKVPNFLCQLFEIQKYFEHDTTLWSRSKNFGATKLTQWMTKIYIVHG